MTHAHLTDEQLSAHLDGEPDDGAAPASEPVDDVEAQIATCGVCRERLAALSAARTLVRLPVVPVPPSVRAAAVEAAISEAFAPDDVAATAPTVAVLTPRRVRQSRVLVGTAAAAVVVVAAIAVPLGLSHGSSPSAQSAAVATTTPHSSDQRAATPSAAPSAADHGVTSTTAAGIRNLGTVTSAGELRSRLTPVVASLGSGKGASSDAFSAAGAPSTTEAAASSGFALNGTVPAAYARCVTVARGAAGVAATLTLVATVTYAHTSALVVVVHPTAGSSTAGPPTTGSSTAGSGSLAVVVARSGCRVLARTTL